VEPFYRAISNDVEGYHFAGYVTLDRSPEAVLKTYPNLTVIDGRPQGTHAAPAALLNQIRASCRRFERDLLLFDPLERMVELWGADTARRFYTRCCPLLLDLGAVAYWSMGKAVAPGLRKAVQSVSQCVISVGRDRLRVTKAEGRPPRIEGSVLHYHVEEGKPRLVDAPMITRLGAALRSVRSERGLTQTQLADMAGISPSAISQAELGRRGLALDTLLDLSAKLGISLDDLIRGQVDPGYRLARRHDPLRRGDERPLALLDDPRAGLRAYLVRLPAGGVGSPGSAHKGIEMVAVATGLVQVTLNTGLPVLRQGEVLTVDKAQIVNWRNLSEQEAMFFWVVRD